MTTLPAYASRVRYRGPSIGHRLNTWLWRMLCALSNPLIRFSHARHDRNCTVQFNGQDATDGCYALVSLLGFGFIRSFATDSHRHRVWRGGRPVRLTRWGRVQLVRNG